MTDSTSVFNKYKAKYPNVSAVNDVSIKKPKRIITDTNRITKNEKAKERAKQLREKKFANVKYHQYSDVVTLSHIQKFKDEQAGILYQLFKDIPLPATMQLYTDLEQAGYTTFLGYWFHPILDVHCKHDATLIFKCGVLENIEQTPGKRVSHFIFRKDKACNLVYRAHVGKDIVERADMFQGWVGTYKGADVVRFMGSLEGRNVYGVANGKETRDFNKKFLRVLDKGMLAEDSPIVCKFDNIVLESIKELKESTLEWVFIDDYEIHHALLFNNESYWVNPFTKSITKKTSSPSTYLNSTKYTEFTTNVVAEFLSSILLSTRRHTILHKTEVTDGIDRWLNRYRRGVCDLPYAWKSEKNYKEILVWISNNCPKVNTSKLLSYTEFIELHSTHTIENILNEKASGI